jgi:hypothetical protein
MRTFELLIPCISTGPGQARAEDLSGTRSYSELFRFCFEFTFSLVRDDRPSKPPHTRASLQARGKLEQSVVVDDKTGGGIVNEGRTSSGMFLRKAQVRSPSPQCLR